jgi:hypothetical protein
MAAGHALCELAPLRKQVPALILYDAPPNTAYTKLGMGYAIMLRNLLGHFDSKVDMVAVQNYTAGQLSGYDATFYLGSYYDNPVPAAFMPMPPAQARPSSGSSTTSGSLPGIRPTASSPAMAST